MSSEKLASIRISVFGITGLITLSYAILALFLGKPDPMPPWIPGLAGVASAIIITIAAQVASRQNAERAFDEGYLADEHRALRISYWVALALYPIFGILLYAKLVEWPVAFAAMGTTTGASFLLLCVWFELRGRS